MVCSTVDYSRHRRWCWIDCSAYLLEGRAKELLERHLACWAQERQRRRLRRKEAIFDAARVCESESVVGAVGPSGVLEEAFLLDL